MPHQVIESTESADSSASFYSETSHQLVVLRSCLPLLRPHQTSEEELARAKWQLKTNYLNSISTVAGANDVSPHDPEPPPAGSDPPLVIVESSTVRWCICHGTCTPRVPASARTYPCFPIPSRQNLGKQLLAYGRVLSTAEFFTR
jgi:hypothetical protein